GSAGNNNDLLLGHRGDSVGTVTNGCHGSVPLGPLSHTAQRGIDAFCPGRLVPFLSVAMNGEPWAVPGLGMGFSVYGPNTGGVKFDPSGPQRYSVQGSKPVEALVEGAVSYRFNRYLTIGGALALVRLGTEQQVALSVDPLGLEDRAHDVDVYLNA